MFEIVAAPFLALKKQGIVAYTTAVSFAGALIVTVVAKSTLGANTAPLVVGLLVGANTIILASVWYLFGRRLTV